MHCLLNFSSEVTAEKNLKVSYKNKQLIEINKKIFFTRTFATNTLGQLNSWNFYKLMLWVPEKGQKIVPSKFKSYQESWPLFHVHWSVKFLIDTILHRLTSVESSFPSSYNDLLMVNTVQTDWSLTDPLIVFLENSQSCRAWPDKDRDQGLSQYSGFKSLLKFAFGVWLHWWETKDGIEKEL